MGEGKFRRYYNEKLGPYIYIKLGISTINGITEVVEEK